MMTGRAEDMMRSMNQTYTAVVKQDGEWWVGWVEEVPGVNCQERTRDELLRSLRVTLGEALAMDRPAIRGDRTPTVPRPERRSRGRIS